MMQKHAAEALCSELEPLVPEGEVTAVPWAAEGPRDEWIVTVWDTEGTAAIDIFGKGFNARSGYILRRPARGRLLADLTDLAAVAQFAREYIEIVEES